MNMKKNDWWGKDMIISFIATTLSIILTFGTTEFLEQKKKKEEQRQMVMFIIHDLEESIAEMEENDADLRKMSALFVDVLQHPEKIDDPTLVAQCAGLMPTADFSTTAEQIFQSGTDTWNILANVQFIDQVTTAYHTRQSYKKYIVDQFLEDWDQKQFDTKEGFKRFGIDYHVFASSTILYEMREIVDNLKHMMNVTDEDLQQFREQSSDTMLEVKEDSTSQALFDEYMKNVQQKEDL